MPRVLVPEGERGGSAYAWATFSPRIAEGARAFSTAVYAHARLSLREFEAMRGRIAQINGCESCKKFRAARDVPSYLDRFGTEESTFLRNGREPPDEAFYADLEGWRDSSLYSKRERLALEFGERLSLEHRSLESDEGFWEQVKSSFSDEEIVDMAFSASSFIAFGRFNRILDVDGACRIEY